MASLGHNEVTYQLTNGARKPEHYNMMHMLLNIWQRELRGNKMVTALQYFHSKDR